MNNFFLVNIFFNFFLKNSYMDYAIPGQLGFQPPASPIMEAIINLHHFAMFYIVFILFFVFFLIYTILETFTIRVLTQSDVENFKKVKLLYNVKFAHHTLLEILWVIIPSIILLSIAYPSFILLYSMESFIDSFVNLKIVGHQWYWSYEIVQGLVNIDGKDAMYRKTFDSYMIETNDLKKNELRLLETTAPIILPIKTYIRVLITADDVIHCWTVPSLGVKLDAVPGRLNETFIYINRVGHFYGQCSEICGVKHAFMPIEVYGVEIKSFKNYCATKCEVFFFNSIKEFVNEDK